MINDQNDKINEILSKLQDNAAVESVKSKGKGKDKGKRSGQEFYQENICFIIVSFIYAVVFILII